MTAPTKLLLPPPTLDYLKLEFVDFDAEAKICRLRFRPTDTMVNPYGIVQGGVLAAVLDDATGMACARFSAGRPFTTMNLTTEFFRPAHPGKVYLAEGRILRTGRRQITVDGTLVEEGDDQPICRATALQLFLDTDVKARG